MSQDIGQTQLPGICGQTLNLWVMLVALIEPLPAYLMVACRHQPRLDPEH
jgi:hypothetical protein